MSHFKNYTDIDFKSCSNIDFKSFSDINDEKLNKSRKPFIAQNISQIKFKSKYLSLYDGIPLPSFKQPYVQFKDITDSDSIDKQK